MSIEIDKKISQSEKMEIDTEIITALSEIDKIKRMYKIKSVTGDIANMPAGFSYFFCPG